MNTGERRSTWNNYIYAVVAVMVLALLWGATFRSRQRELERTEPKIVVLGDSLIGQCRDETSVAKYLSDRLGTSVFNGAMGGTCIVSSPKGFEGSYSKELMSMTSLVKAMVADDFGVQRTVRSRQAATEYFRDNIEELQCIDFHTVDVLLLEYGLNDYHAALPIENPKNPMDEKTLTGAVRSAVRDLRKAYPDLRVIIVTPTFSWYVNDNLTCEEYDTGNGCLEKYVNAEIDVARELGVEFVDLYHTAYSHEDWEDWKIYTEDGLHPSEKGRQIIAELIAKKITGEERIGQ